MEVSKLIQNMREQGIGIWTEGGKIRYLKKDGKLDDDIKNILIYNKKEIISYFEEERERFDKFPLTDIQMAYLLGRKNSFEYGDVASHLYLELDYPALDSVKVQKIWNQLIDKHDMLRAIVLEDGTQEVLRDVAEYPIYISTKCEEIRSKWSDKYYNTETWPMFDIGVTEDKEKTTLHLSFDFLIADWASIWTLLIEFETIYYNKGNGDEKCAISFRNYVLNEMGMKNSSRYRRDKEYWKNRLDIIPEAPVLPMRSNAEKSNKFIRMARKLSAEDWEKIKFFSSQNSVTPTATVLSIFALCIERWSVNKKFSLNLTTLIRNNKYTGIYNTIGDFTSVDVLEIDLSEKIIFADFVKNVNKQIFEDLDHSSYSGIEVIRDLRKRRKNPMLFFPIIFTSSIGLIKNDGMVGKVNNNGISQTPQAFLDCQVMDNEEGLFINWDIRNGIFEEGVIQDIFCTFLTYLKKISESVEFWNQQANVELPEKQMDQRKNVNSTFKEIKMDTLQNLFLKSALEMPKKTAVVDECGEHTYEELLWTAYGIADELQKCSCKAGDYVGIKLNKSFFQIASVLGTLLIGAAFVPIDNDQPEIRADKILEIAKIKCLIGEKEETHKYREKYKWIDKDSVILKKSYDEIVNDNFDDVAYVIFTSGSTGEPKGVVIEQQAVVNTIIDINERFQVKDKDSILALSQLHFDLSVYDIFGMLATGGTIVIPEKVRYKDPSYWLMLVEKWNITVWNSVPAFMEMFVDYLERFYKGEKLSINKILLSGDWIPVKLPEKICRFLKDVRIYSLEIHKGAEVSIKEYFYGNSYFSHGATQDVISSMINNKSKSMSFFYKDEIIPCKMRIGESICIDEKVGTMYLYPIISKDFRRVCKETGVKEGCFFNTFSDLSSMASFFEIGSKIYHSNSMDTFGYTEQLEKMYRNKSTENEKTIFWFGIELVNGNDVEKKLMSFEYACNWNSLSGYVCALVAEWCLNDEISKGKAYNLDEIEGIQKFIESLPGEIKQNIVKL